MDNVPEILAYLESLEKYMEHETDPEGKAKIRNAVKQLNDKLDAEYGLPE